MPTYEYICSKCNHQFEKYQSINDASLTVCPRELCGLKKWGKGKVKRAITSGAGLLFKGTGFYITDYRSEGYKQAAKKDSEASGGTKPAAEGKSSAEGKAESKPAAKAEMKSESKPKPKPSAT